MKNIFISMLLLLMLASCTSVNNIYTNENIKERQLHKLVKNYLRNPNDTSVFNQVRYAYQQIQEGYLNNITILERNHSLKNLEQLVKCYDELQAFYDRLGQYHGLGQLLEPGDVTGAKKQAVYHAAEAWYEHALLLLNNDTWQSGREALTAFRKVNNWVPNFRESQLRMQEAMELGTIDAVIRPLRSEGFFYNSLFNNTGLRFSQQLAADLGNSWHNHGRYRVYPPEETWYQQPVPDWIIEPVITRMSIEPATYSKSFKTVTRQVEIGKDSLKNPVYKNISAILTITEASVCAVSELEARIIDVKNRSPYGSRNFSETFTFKEWWATYTGDKNALNKEDWILVNNRNTIRIDESFLQEKLLEKCYPALLAYLKQELQ